MKKCAMPERAEKGGKRGSVAAWQRVVEKCSRGIVHEIVCDSQGEEGDRRIKATRFEEDAYHGE